MVRRETRELRYDFGDVVVIVSGVPVLRCDDCGEELVEGPLAVQLDRVVRQVAESARIVAGGHASEPGKPIETEWRLPSAESILASA